MYGHSFRQLIRPITAFDQTRCTRTPLWGGSASQLCPVTIAPRTDGETRHLKTAGFRDIACSREMHGTKTLGHSRRPHEGNPGETLVRLSPLPRSGRPDTRWFSILRLSERQGPGDGVPRALCDVYLSDLHLVEDLEHRSPNNSQLPQNLRQFGIVEKSLRFSCRVEVAHQYYLVLVFRVPEDSIVFDPVTVAKCLHALGVVALRERGDILDLCPTCV